LRELKFSKKVKINIKSLVKKSHQRYSEERNLLFNLGGKNGEEKKKSKESKKSY
jgi:hypothetical protein